MDMIDKPPVGTKVRFLGVKGDKSLSMNIGKIGTVVDVPQKYGNGIAAQMFLDVRFDDWISERTREEISFHFLLASNDEFEIVE